MKAPVDFYVYEHRRADTGAVFYVGKGCKDRALSFSNRNKHWRQVFGEAGGVTVGYVAKNLCEEFALFVEQECIDVLKRRGTQLANITAGGDGLSGMVFSEEHKRKIAAAKLGKPRDKDVVARMRATKKGRGTGAQNAFYGRRHSEKTKALLRQISGSRTHSEDSKAKIKKAVLRVAQTWSLSRPVRCLDNNTVYFSLNEAARQLGLHRRCITMVCNKEMHHTAGYKFEWSTT
jgi:hypothetical protein